MFRKILIANRGEIAVRVIRACRELGIASVAVHSTADEEALHVKLADESVCIGPPPARQSYLNMPALLSAAEITNADAVHPGYGFLAESAHFAELCHRAGLTFIGPQPELMRLLGDKVAARAAMAERGLPVLPGSGLLTSDEEAMAVAARIGLPLIIKAVAGGGGRGMKMVRDIGQLCAQLATARKEAEAAFGDGGVYLERLLEAPRHIEVQVLGDGCGRCVAVGERECSIQRRHQKLVEEAPAPALSAEEREDLLGRAAQAVAALHYRGVGTLEFLLERDEQGRARLYFMEMNPRIQVEHTVTEMVTGLDLVREQICVAAGAEVAVLAGRAPIVCRGHSIEVRINAEDPVTFAPSPGCIRALHLPGGPGIRVDTHIYAGYSVPPHYDSLLCKLVVHDEDRPAAVRRLRRALHELVIEGPQTNLDLHRRIVDHPDFIAGRLDTRLLERLAS
ncbi:MAG: acetyl-CoA carboxylase biotin carboxylase subunit [Myxococcales bacterium]|nr:acetyl-CoA carboxylase biotin carboxylase subunit [Myxococcota bacterium]MDW8283789.1 acetyl-CoA carboxylase biotin carboxylase subunit [Myxococcales bacterium]